MIYIYESFVYLQESKYFHTSYENDIARLVIDEIYPEDQGVYLCRAINDAGVTQSTCDVTVTCMYTSYSCILLEVQHTAFYLSYIGKFMITNVSLFIHV